MSRCSVTALSETTVFPFSSIRLCVMEASHTMCSEQRTCRTLKLEPRPQSAVLRGRLRGRAQAVSARLRRGRRALRAVPVAVPCAALGPGRGSAHQLCPARQLRSLLQCPCGREGAIQPATHGTKRHGRQAGTHSRISSSWLLPLRGRDHPVCHC